MKNKNTKILGYTLMLLGVFLPLYCFLNLSFYEISSKREYKKFIENEKKIPEEKSKEILKNSKNYNENIENKTNFVDPFSNSTYKTIYNLDLEKNKIFSYIRIPKIDLFEPIRLGATKENLEKGACHIDGTNLPIGGISTRSVIAGHRGWYKAIRFLNIGKLKKDDLVFIDVLGKTLKYKVINKEIIKPYETEKIKKIENKDILTLLSCDPIAPPSENRILINCERKIENIKTKNEKNKIETNEKLLIPNDIKIFKILTYSITIFLTIIFLYILKKLYHILKNK